VALDQEAVGTASGLLVTDVDLTVGEIESLRRNDPDTELVRDLLRKLGVGAAREEHHLLLALRLKPGHSTSLLRRVRPPQLPARPYSSEPGES
jgi:hypothetical protein